MKIIIEGISHINVRDENQDVIASTRNKSNNVLMVLADGMGGHTNGKLCAQFFVKNLIKEFSKSDAKTWPDGNPFHWIERKLYFFKKELYKYVLDNNLSEDMGTTIVGVILVNWTLFCFNVGDSRCYTISNQSIKQITVDQIIGSYPELRHLGNPVHLTSALGPTKKTTLDFSYLTIDKNVTVLLTSDGVHGIINNNRIKEIFTNGTADLKIRTQVLVNEARIMGSKDNASCISMGFK